MSQEVCDQFERLRWHDSKLMGIHVRTVDNTHEINMAIQWVPRSGDNWIESKVLFSNCTYIMADLDLGGKTLCSDSIACGVCSIDSELKARIQREQFKFEPGHLDEFFHFTIELIQPGGEIHIFAKSFEAH